MKKILMIAALGLVTACAEAPVMEEPMATPVSTAPTPSPAPPSGQVYTPPEPFACDRSDYPAGSAGDADYANCVIQS